MAYDENLADRVMMAVEMLPDISTRKMFGGYAVMWRGNMLVGVIGDGLMVRVGPEQYDELVVLPGASPMEFTGRPMKGMVTVDADAVEADADLQTWLERAQDFVQTLPAK